MSGLKLIPSLLILTRSVVHLITYKFKLYKSNKNKYLHRSIELASEIYNHTIALYKRYYKMYDKYINAYAMMKHITKLKRLPKYKHWYNLDAQAIQDIVGRIDKAYTLFFNNLKRRVRTAPPGFKKRKNYKSFTLKQTGYKILDDNTIIIGKKHFRYSKSREIQGNVKLVTVKRDRLGDTYIYITTDYVRVEFDTVPRTGSSVGFDFGLKTYLTASDGNDIASPLFFNSNRTSIKAASRNVSRKVKGSNNRRKALMHQARIHKRVANQRSDFQWKLAHDLVTRYDIIYIEDLNLAGMQRLWGKKISDLSHASFVQKLKYLALVNGKVVHSIGRYEPSSKTCSVCGYIHRDLELRDRTWVCPECSTDHDRDRNASINI